MTAHPAGAQTPSGEGMADSCSGCHGEGGRSRSAIPRLAGWQAPALAAAMRAFRDGPQPGTVMGRIARGFTDAEIDALAAALSARTARSSSGGR